MRRSSPTWSKGRGVRARAAGSVRNVAERRGGRRVSGGGPGDGLPLVSGGEPAGCENRAPLACKAFGVGGVRAQERALGDSRWAAEGESESAGQPVGRRPGSRVDEQGGRRFLPARRGTRRVEGLEVDGRLRFVMEGGEPGNRVEEVWRLAEEESGEARSVWISINWDLRMGVKEALEQQRALTELVEGSELVVKTTVLEEDLDEWPGADLRGAQVMHSGTLWLAREGLALSRVSPAVEL